MASVSFHNVEKSFGSALIYVRLAVEVQGGRAELHHGIFGKLISRGENGFGSGIETQQSASKILHGVVGAFHGGSW